MSKASTTRVIALAVALTSVSLTVASAAAAPTSSTTVDIQRATAVNNDQSILTFGTLSSSSSKCVANRKVEIYYDTNPDEGPFTKVDVARTSDNGEWAGIADTDSISRVKVVAVKTSVGRKHHRRTCLGDTSPIIHLV